MQKSLLLICVVGLSCVSRGAQTDRASWDNLSGMHSGQKIQVVDMHLKKHSGTFVSVSSTELSYQDSAGEQTIQKQEVRYMQLMKNKHRLRNTLIGGAGGACRSGDRCSDKPPMLIARLVHSTYWQRRSGRNRRGSRFHGRCSRRSLVAESRNDLQRELALACLGSNSRCLMGLSYT